MGGVDGSMDVDVDLFEPASLGNASPESPADNLEPTVAVPVAHAAEGPLPATLSD